MKRVTIKEIASLCGVSISTVSRAINNGEEINEQTKKKILKTIDKLGYVPTQNARNLKITKTKILTIIKIIEITRTIEIIKIIIKIKKKKLSRMSQKNLRNLLFSLQSQ